MVRVLSLHCTIVHDTWELILWYSIASFVPVVAHAMSSGNRHDCACMERRSILRKTHSKRRGPFRGRRTVAGISLQR